jgi:hypothetical protein
MKKLFLALLVTLSVFGCRPEIDLQRPDDYFNMTNPDNTSMSTIFEGFWHGMNNNYVFWDVDPTDWDAVYDTYKPKFEKLGTIDDLYQDSERVTLMRDYFAEMLKDIVDGHYGMQAVFTLPDGNLLSVNPSGERYQKRFTTAEAYEQSENMAEGSINNDGSVDKPWNPYFIDAVENSITGDFKLLSYLIPGENGYNLFNVATGYKTENGKDILYFHFSGFSWQTLFDKFFELFPKGREDGNWAAITDALKEISADPDDPVTIRDAYAYSNIGGIENGRFTSRSDSDLKYLIDELANSGITLPEKVEWIDLVSIRAVVEHFDYFFDQLAAKKNDATDNPVCGAIIDIRGNGGGAIQDLSTLWGRIVDSDYVFAKKKFKAGENRLDYTPLVDFIIFKAPANNYGGVTDIPLVLLVNKGSVSCSEMTTLFFKSLPNGRVVGGETWGGMGELSPLDSRNINAGQFMAGRPDPTGKAIISLVYTPGLQVLTRDGVSYEGKGVPPEFPVDFNYNHMIAGTDDRLQKAIDIVVHNTAKP